MDPARTLSNMTIPQALAQMLDVLTGELGGPGGEHVAQARESTRAALAAPDLDAQGEHVDRAQAALEQAAQARPQRPPVTRAPLTVTAVTPAPGGAVITLAHASPVTLSRSLPLFLMLGGPEVYGWAWIAAHAGTPAACLYALPPYLITAAAESLGFSLASLARLQAAQGSAHETP